MKHPAVLSIRNDLIRSIDGRIRQRVTFSIRLVLAQDDPHFSSRAVEGLLAAGRYQDEYNIDEIVLVEGIEAPCGSSARDRGTRR